jgi:hypothetical protein
MHVRQPSRSAAIGASPPHSKDEVGGQASLVLISSQTCRPSASIRMLVQPPVAAGRVPWNSHYPACGVGMCGLVQGMHAF